VKFGPVPVAEAEGAILAHSTSVGEKRLRKARRLSAEDVEDLKRAGLKQVVVAVLEADDVVEDDAAAMIASSLAVEGIEVKPPATGRVNLHAEQAGLFLVDKSLIDALNRVDPSITVATLAAHASVERGQMVATVKIIPFAVRRSLVEKAAAVAAANSVALAVRPFRPMQVGLIQTELPSVKQSTP
jgi:molybdenum cofactor cytidylyltransferase